MDFIDAKRSTQAIFKEKDLVVYPKLARKVEFWCLYGKTKGLFEVELYIEAKSSEEIVSKLHTFKTKENLLLLNNLIMKIRLLKKGYEFNGQSTLLM
jgi:hypothetical protein